jgi:hypothetical protein
VHAVEQPGLPLENLRADASAAAKRQCALKGGRPLITTYVKLEALPHAFASLTTSMSVPDRVET